MGSQLFFPLIIGLQFELLMEVKKEKIQNVKASEKAFKINEIKRESMGNPLMVFLSHQIVHYLEVYYLATLPYLNCPKVERLNVL